VNDCGSCVVNPFAIKHAYLDVCDSDATRLITCYYLMINMLILFPRIASCFSPSQAPSHATYPCPCACILLPQCYPPTGSVYCHCKLVCIAPRLIVLSDAFLTSIYYLALFNVIHCTTILAQLDLSVLFVW